MHHVFGLEEFGFEPRIQWCCGAIEFDLRELFFEVSSFEVQNAIGQGVTLNIVNFVGNPRDESCHSCDCAANHKIKRALDVFGSGVNAFDV